MVRNGPRRGKRSRRKDCWVQLSVEGRCQRVDPQQGSGESYGHASQRVLLFRMSPDRFLEIIMGCIRKGN